MRLITLRLVLILIDHIYLGSSCKVIGWGYGFNATVTLDQKPFEFTFPEVTEGDVVLFEAKDLDVGYHTFVFNTSYYMQKGELARTSISRVEIDTGLTGYVLMLRGFDSRRILSSYFRRMVPKISYGADSDVWDRSGEWQIRTIDSAGTLRSIRSREREDYLQISGGLEGRMSLSFLLVFLFITPHDLAGVIFLYGNAGSDHGQMLVSVHNRTTTGDVDPSVFLTSAASAAVSDSLLYYAVIPPEGWKEISIQNVDIRGRFTEITRLDVYGPETKSAPGPGYGAFLL